MADTTHPLSWGDTELAYLITTGLSTIDLYRAMHGRTDKTRPPQEFVARIYKLGYDPKRRASQEKQNG